MKLAKAVNIHSFFNGIGGSIISIFVPVLIMMYIGDLNCVMWYILTHYATSILTIILLHKLSLKYPIVTLFVHMIPLILSPILISILPFTFGLCIVLGVLGGLVHGLYYVTSDNLQIRAHGNINLAKFDACCNLGHFAFAVISAFILGSTLENSLLLTCMLAIVMYVASIIPLILAQRKMRRVDWLQPPQYKTPRTKYYIFTLLFISFFGIGLIIYTMILPVYMYDVGASIELVGVTFGLIYLVDVAVDFLGRYLRLHNKHWLSVVLYGIIFVGSMLAIMLLPTTSVLLMVISTLCSLLYLMCCICMSGELMTRVKQDNCAYSTLPKTNALFSASRILVLIVYFIFPSYTTIWIMSIICTVLAVIFGLLSFKYKNEHDAPVEIEDYKNEVKTA